MRTSIKPSSIRVRRDGANPDGRYAELPRKNSEVCKRLVVERDAHRFVAAQRVKHRVEAGQRLADSVLELLPGPHERRVGADACGVDDGVGLIERRPGRRTRRCRRGSRRRSWPTVSQPMSLAKWLNVPPGNTANGNPASTATAAAHETVPSPPPTASTSARSAAERSTSSSSLPAPTSTISALGRASRTSSTIRAPVPPPDAGLTTSTTPSPSGRAGCRHAAGLPWEGAGLDEAAPLARPARRSRRRCRNRRTRRPGSARRWPPGTGRPGRPAAPAPGRGAGSPARHRRRTRPHWRSGPTAASWRWASPRTPGERAPTRVRPRPSPHPLGDLVGDQAGGRQARPPRGRRRGCIDGLPTRRCAAAMANHSLEWSAAAGQPGHDGVQQRARRFRDRLEYLAVQRAQALADLPDAAGVVRAKFP